MHLLPILLAPSIFAILAVAADKVSIKVDASHKCYLDVQYKGCSGKSKPFGTATDKEQKDCRSSIDSSANPMLVEGKGCGVMKKDPDRNNLPFFVRLEEQEYYAAKPHDIVIARGGERLVSCRLYQMVAGKDSCTLKAIKPDAP